ncbi:relaxase/mobilization nuclease domain-containing protein [Mucilaginibacter ximonensis]|uniref:Relaxase/mobilization nuclease domain-containing protein n=1 Tax=Mucilaginibacter ximonensis TaxID=538021 RepID=A0ABW5YA99_9SPHI
MVAVIHHSNRIDKMLNYNEHKVGEGIAKCLEAAHYPKDLAGLNFYQKMAGLDKLRSLSTRKINSVHISLNFDPSEKLSAEKLKAIAADYMEKIGFKDQPYLLYEHYDSGHPHVHIVTTNIRADGSAIELHNIGSVQSEIARKAIEIAFGLVKAQDSERQEKQRVKPVNVQQALYGKTETKRAISGVLNYVLSAYKFASLPELNAVLKCYNIVADRGDKESRMYRNNGLVYSMLDKQGNKVGVPIKASDFHIQPTLKFLSKKYAANEAARLSKKTHIKNTVDLALLKSISIDKLIESLKKDGIDAILRKSLDGIIYGITYVDHKEKVVFNGSDLGKNYSAKAIQERCALPLLKQPNLLELKLDLATILLDTQEPSEALPFELKQQKKKKRKRLQQ